MKMQKVRSGTAGRVNKPGAQSKNDPDISRVRTIVTC